MKNIFNKMTTMIVALLVLTASSATAAVWCGMTVTTDVELGRDLYCDSSGLGYAMRVETDHISIDLNGSRIYGDGTGKGIEVNKANGFKLVGNGGSITHFERAVDLNDVSESIIHDVLFYKNQLAAITNTTLARNSKENQYFKNVFIYGEFGLNIVNNPGYETTQQSIGDNQFYQVGINIRLQNATNNNVLNNFIWKSQDAGVVLVESDFNHIQDNVILDSRSQALEISNSSNNSVIGNSFDGGRYGLFLIALEFDGCCTLGDVSEFNDIQSNHFFNFDFYGVYLRPFSCDEVRFNKINNNKIYDSEAGVYLSREVQNNDLSKNAFTGTLTPFFDLSDGSNIY